jgi:hypothetical protein
MWGPYEIKKEAFELGVKRLALLDGGTIRYKADDRLTRKDRMAINCFHAMEGLDQPFPAGGFLDTGFRMWGIDGTGRVLIEYTNAVRDRGLILEPVDIKKDLYGFVYALKRNSCGSITLSGMLPRTTSSLSNQKTQRPTARPLFAAHATECFTKRI